LDRAQTILFGPSQAEIFVTFADGPGRYQLQIVDSRAQAVKVIFDRRIVSEAEAWTEWDGKDYKGRQMPGGQYFVIFYKDGKPLRSISIIRAVPGE
jgi:hypothetical protein